MKKAFILGFIIFLFLVGCKTQNVEMPEENLSTITWDTETELEEEYDIIGEYICQGEIYDQFKDDAFEYIPAVRFYEDGNCMLRVYYIGGVDDVEGVYNVAGNEIHVQLDLEWTLFEGTVSDGVPYMDDEYIFEITDEDHLVIDRECYVVNAEDPFVRISTEPEPTTEPEYDIIGRYVCSNDYYDDPTYYMTHPWPIPYIKFLKEGHCMLFVDQEGGREIWGQYRIEGNKIYVYELQFRYLEMIDEVRDNMAHEYVFTIVDEEHLTIEPGFFDVQAGDSFVKVPQGDS